MSKNISKEQEKIALVIYDKEAKTVNGVQVDESNPGKYRTAPFDNRFTPFYFDPQSDLLTNFIRNFGRQYENPSRFAIYSIPKKFVKNVTEMFSTKNKESVLSKKGTLLSQKFSSESKSVLPEKPVIQTGKQSEMTQPEESRIQEEKTSDKPEEVQTVEQEKKQIGKENRQPPFPLEKFEWKEFERLGLSRAHLEQMNQGKYLNSLQYGNVLPLMVSTSFQTTSGSNIEVTGRLGVKINEKGDVVPKILGIKNSIDLNIPYKEYTFTAEDQKNLRSAGGNLGHPVKLVLDSNKPNVKTECFVSLDQATNRLAHRPVFALHIPDEWFGVKFSTKEKRILSSGGKIYRKDWHSKTTGQTYSGSAQYNAVFNLIQVAFDSPKQSQTVEIKDREKNNKEQKSSKLPIPASKQSVSKPIKL